LKISGEVAFKKGNLVQICWSDLDYTFKMERKLVPKWSQLHHVRKRIQNTYLLEQLDGTPIKGEFSARRLHMFIPRREGQLEKDQKEWEEQHKNGQDEEEAEEGAEEGSRGYMVWTLLFVEGEHGVGDRELAGKKDARHQMPI
jgi:hypothetical protein